MFCPRCGSPINESLKFCRACGLPLAQISTYVATGGTANLAPGQPPPLEYDEYLTPRQKLSLTIVLMLLAPALLGLLSEAFGLPEELIGIPAVLLPVGILWAVFHYKAVMRRRKNQALLAANAFPVNPMQYAQPLPGEAYQNPLELPPPRTNPLADVVPGSVIEDETRKLHEKR
jgi:hypothetical protein